MRRPSPPSPSAAAAVTPRSCGTDTIFSRPSAAMPRSVRPSRRSRGRSSEGIRTIRTSAASASAASTSSGAVTPTVADSVPASAGPMTSAELKLVVSSAFAGGSSSPGTSDGIMLVKPPNESG